MATQCFHQQQMSLVCPLLCCDDYITAFTVVMSCVKLQWPCWSVWTDIMMLSVTVSYISVNVRTLCQNMSNHEIFIEFRIVRLLISFCVRAIRPTIVWACAWVSASEVPHWEPHSPGAGRGDVRGTQWCLHVLWPQTGWRCSESREREWQ